MCLFSFPDAGVGKLGQLHETRRKQTRAEKKSERELEDVLDIQRRSQVAEERLSLAQIH